MPTFVDRMLRRFGVDEARARKLERLSRMAAVVLMVLTGLFFIIWPPMSTHALWGGNWPPYAWGFFMVLGGVLSIWGLCNRVLQTEQTGMFILALSVGFYTLNQTMIMFQVPITPTRAGGTAILGAFLATAVSRYFGLLADIAASRALRRLEGQ